MYSDELIKKLAYQEEKAKQAATGDCCAPKAQTANGAALGGYSPRQSLMDRLTSHHNGLVNQGEKVRRAHEILTKHPEFEEFVELQDLINGGLFY